MELLVVTGMSGAGKTNALRTLEDIGYYCVDNLPPQLVLYLLDAESGAGMLREKTAVTVDVRSAQFPGFEKLLTGLGAAQRRMRILYLDASDEQIRRRYKETRRLHPLILQGEASDMDEALRLERERLAPLRQMADIVVDTSSLRASEQRQKLIELFTEDGVSPMAIEFTAFGYKYGILTDADLVFDVRCLPNPFYEDALRHLTGDDPAVREYVLGSEEGRELFGKIRDLLEYVIPLYRKEGKNRLVIGFGCTGGQHRSLVFAGKMKEYFAERYPRVTLTKRDLSENRYELYAREQ